MIGAHLPQRVMPAHTVPADQDILQRVVKRMAHMQAARYIGRRDHDGKCLCARLGIRARRAHLFLLPQRRNPRLGCGGIKVLFHRHRGSPSLGKAIAKLARKAKAKVDILPLSLWHKYPRRRLLPVPLYRPVQPCRQMDQAFR